MGYLLSFDAEFSTIIDKSLFICPLKKAPESKRNECFLFGGRRRGTKPRKTNKIYTRPHLKITILKKLCLKTINLI